jgi:hypothetical protein
MNVPLEMRTQHLINEEQLSGCLRKSRMLTSWLVIG